jgi:hypothetical protein
LRSHDWSSDLRRNRSISAQRLIQQHVREEGRLRREGLVVVFFEFFIATVICIVVLIGAVLLRKARRPA